MSDLPDELYCQCPEQETARCDMPATAEDMRCDVCRAGCGDYGTLAAEDLEFHTPADGTVDWDALERVRG